MTTKSKTNAESMKNNSIETLDDFKLDKIIEKIINDNKEIIQNQKERAVGPLMGIAMKDLRGKASGEMINNILLKKIKKILESE